MAEFDHTNNHNSAPNTDRKSKNAKLKKLKRDVVLQNNFTREANTNMEILSANVDVCHRLYEAELVHLRTIFHRCFYMIISI